MNPRQPRLTGKETVNRLASHGFDVSRIKGSHYFLTHADGRVTVVPVHAGETIGPGLLKKICRDVGIAPHDL